LHETHRTSDSQRMSSYLLNMISIFLLILFSKFEFSEIKSININMSIKKYGLKIGLSIAILLIISILGYIPEASATVRTVVSSCGGSHEELNFLDDQYPTGQTASMNLLGQFIYKDSNGEVWSEPLRLDKKLSNANSWREVHEENKAALRPRLQDINTR
jgi:hypothetical protein